MSRLLDRSSEDEVFLAVMEAVDGLGLLNHELIPGVLKAAYRLAEATSLPEQALDEASLLFADGFFEASDEGGEETTNGHDESGPCFFCNNTGEQLVDGELIECPICGGVDDQP